MSKVGIRHVALQAAGFAVFHGDNFLAEEMEGAVRAQQLTGGKKDAVLVRGIREARVFTLARALYTAFTYSTRTGEALTASCASFAARAVLPVKDAIRAAEALRAAKKAAEHDIVLAAMRMAAEALTAAGRERFNLEDAKAFVKARRAALAAAIKAKAAADAAERECNKKLIEAFWAGAKVTR